MKKGAGGAVVVIIAVVVIGYGLFSGQVSIEQVIGELLGETSGSGSSSGSGQPAGSGPATAQGAPAPPSAAEARQRLDKLTVAPAGSMAGYSREKFPHWSDAQEFG